MNFSDINFIFIFLPVFLLLYYLVPSKGKNVLLLVGSLVFYSFTKWWYLPIVLADTVIAFAFGKWINRSRRDSANQHILLEIAVLFQIILLVLLKRAGTFPVGFSFLAFQLISYFFDVANNKCKAETSILKFTTYVCMFPKLLQGPITRYTEVQNELKNGVSITRENMEAGFRMFVVGLSYKTLLADRLAILWKDVRTIGFESISTPLAWIAMFGYSLQLFLDFQGYSLMAMGLGKMLGFQLPANFDSPYMARSISEFYRKWHATLGRWFKDYVYIPLGGSRKGFFRTTVNLLLVWLLTGLWHGFSLNFLLWAAFLVLLIFFEKNVYGVLLQKENIFAKIFSHGYVLLFIPMSWMLFAITDMKELVLYFSRLFGISQTIENACINGDDYLKYAAMYWPYFVGGALCATPLVEKFLLGKKKGITTFLLLLLFWLCIYFVMKSANNPFMYINF